MTEKDTNNVHVSRRAVLSAIAGTGLMATAVGASKDGDSVASVGGGSMSDQLGDLQVPVYYGTEAEMDDGGVSGRVYVVWEPGTDAHGAVYYDDGNGWSLQDRKFGSVQADELPGEWTKSVNSLSDLESLSISDGDVVRIKQPDTPYRLTSWVQLDGAQSVVVEFESRFAANGEPIIKVADGGNVGGFEVGYNSSVSNIEFINLGFDGNHPNQDQAVKRLHAVKLDAVDGATFKNPHIERTSPYHEHSTGGSGISANDNAADVTVEDAYMEEIGDRGIQAAVSDSNLTVRNSEFVGMFDRAMTTIMQRDDGTQVKSRGPGDIKYLGNTVRDSYAGSCYHVHGDVERVIVNGCSALGTHRSLFEIIGNAKKVIISDCIGIRDGSDTGWNTATHGIELSNVDAKKIIMDSIIHVNAGQSSIRLSPMSSSNDFDAKLTNLQLYDPTNSGISIAAGSQGIEVIGSTIEGPGEHGILNTGTGNRFIGNTIRKCGKLGFNENGTNSWYILNKTESNRQSTTGAGNQLGTSTNARLVANIFDEPNASTVGLNESTGDATLKFNWALSSGFFMADGSYAHGNEPAIPHNAPPTSPTVGMVALASANWDPDGDSNGEKVIYDGSWQEVADMPNLT